MPRRMPWYATILCLLGLLAASSAFAQCNQILPIGVMPPTGGWTADCAHRVSLKLGASLGPGGNYILIDLPACASGPCGGQSGASAIQCLATNGYTCCLAPSLVVPTITGTNVGALVTGLNARIALDTDQRPGICLSAYQGNAERLAYVSIATLSADRTTMTLAGLQLVFLTGPPTGTGTSTVLPVEILPAGAVPVHASTWGGLKMLYR